MERLLALQRLAVLALLALLVGRVLVVRRPPNAQPPPRPLSLFVTVVIGLFGVAMAWQTFWTVAPGAVPAFRDVERFDPRAWDLQGGAERRGVVDRLGRPLIVNRRAGEQVLRHYPLGSAAAHVTGYHHRRYGKTGVEAAWDDRLATWRRSAWRELAEGGEESPPPLALTLDSRLQTAAAEALNGRPGAVVALNPVTGDILALVSAPAFEPDQISAETFPTLKRSEAGPLLNRALRGLYPPGSTFKPLLAAAALERGLTADTVFESDPRGYLPPGDTARIEDYQATLARRQGTTWDGLGPLTMRQAMARSANGYFAWLGVELGSPRLHAFCERVRLTRAWRLSPGGRGAVMEAAPGHLPDEELKPGETARWAIGQHDLLVTPLGLAVVTGAVANYGTLAPPRLALDESVGEVEIVMDPLVAEAVMGMMREVVESPAGTGRGLALPGVPVAAKTGSAENPHGAPHAWVAAFAPAEAATVVVVAVVENGGTGGAAAAPVVKAVMEAARAADYFVETEALEGDGATGGLTASPADALQQTQQ